MKRAQCFTLLLLFAVNCCMAVSDSALWSGVRSLGVLYRQGHKDSATVRTQELMTTAEQQHNYAAQAMLHAMLGTISSDQGDKQSALKEFATVAGMAEEHQLLDKAKSQPAYRFLIQTLVPVYAQLALLCDETGQPALCLEYARNGLEWAAANDKREQTSLAVAMLTEVLVKHGGDISVSVPGDGKGQQDPPTLADAPPAGTPATPSAEVNGRPKAGPDSQPPPPERHIEYVRVADGQAKTVPPAVVVALCLLVVLILLWQWYSRRQKEQETQLRVDESYREGQEEERNRLAKELHDSVSNQLLAVEMKIRDEGGLSKQTMRLLSESREHVRRVSHELLPPEFEHATLADVIANYAQELNGIGHCAISYTATPPDADWKGVPTKTALEIYRIVQEAVGNAMKHGHATAISIGLHQEPSSHGLTVIVSSDGKPYQQQPTTGIGLLTMKHRAQTIGGQLEFGQLPLGNMVRLTIKNMPVC